MVVELHIVSEGNKARVRIATWINPEGRAYDGVYNNGWNCRFPRNLRETGKRYQVPDDNVKVQMSKNGVFFYSVSTKGLVSLQRENHISKDDLSTIYETSPECVICMSADSDMIFVPCGHLCSCKTCGERLDKCCICRVAINQRVPK
jgi:hypothetical protein